MPNKDLDSAYEGLGAPQGGQAGGGYGVGYAPPAQAGIGGNGMIFLALGAVAFAVIMFVKVQATRTASGRCTRTNTYCSVMRGYVWLC